MLITIAYATRSQNRWSKGQLYCYPHTHLLTYRDKHMFNDTSYGQTNYNPYKTLRVTHANRKDIV